MPRSRPPAPPRGPQGPQGPSLPGQPNKRSSRFGKRSKTKNIKCSEAASAWQLAIKHGGSPGKEVYKVLAQCRAANKTAKAGMAAGTAAGAALASRAVTSRIDRGLATASSRKAELKKRIQERAGRTISDADRQRANDIASRVSGNTGGPSAGLRRLQGVRSPRTRQTSTPAATPAPARAPRTRRATTPRVIPDAGQTNRLPDPVRQQMGLQPALRTASGIRSEAAALFRNMRATGRGQQALNIRGMARGEIVARDGLSRYLNDNLRAASPRGILDIASRQGVTKQPIIQGPKAPRVGLEAYRASRALRTAPGVAESRSAAARGLMALRQAGGRGRSDAQAIRQLTSSTSTGRRGENTVSAIVQLRGAAGRVVHERGLRAVRKAYDHSMGNQRDMAAVPANRSAAASELATARRFRNASLAATGDRGPRDHWRAATSNIQLANPVINTNLRDAAGTGSRWTGFNRQPAVDRWQRQSRLGQSDLATQQAAAAQRSAATAQAAAAAQAPAASARRTHGVGSSYTPAQLTTARRQAGTFGDYASRSPHTPVERAAAVTKAGNLGLKLAGRTTDQKFNHLASILGAPPEAARHIRVTVTTKEIKLYNAHANAGGHTRTIKIDPADGRPMVYNNYYIPNQTARAAGMATDHYNRQILAARAAGIQRVQVSGAGYGQNNVDTSSQYATGYHVWVEYGFDGPIGRSGVAAMAASHPSLATITPISTFNQTIHHPDPVVARAARDAWRMRGVGTDHVSLEIADPSSSSMKVYTNLYKKRRNEDWRQSNVNTNASRAGNYDIYR